ncbi:IS3 family transposase [Streptomyces sp. NPDC001348]
MCELLKVSRTAFYARRAAKPGPRAVRDAELAEQIADVHTRSQGTYGAPRVHAVLKRAGAGCGRRRVARLMRAAGLQGRHRRRRHLTTIPDPRWLGRLLSAPPRRLQLVPVVGAFGCTDWPFSIRSCARSGSNGVLDRVTCGLVGHGGWAPW